MNIKDIKDELESSDIDADLSDEISKKLDELKKTGNKKEIYNNKKKVFELKNEIDKETDWRKKSSLRARIISLNLE